MEQVKKAIAESKKTKEEWCDPQFEPSSKTFGKKVISGEIVWKRAHEFMGMNPQVFYEGIEPNDIEQGNLGDCYFLSSLSVLAERPYRIQSIFLTPNSNEAGCYCVRLFFQGIPQEVVVDDRFPCFSGSGPCFSRNKGKELWVLILEKCYAKLHGSYGAIESGQTSRALNDLTGAPCKLLNIREMDELDLSKLLLEYDKLDYVLCASVPDVPDVDLKKTVGLVEGHAYGLIAVATVGNTTLLQLRNPWGEVEWKGDWSDKDTKNWTPEIKKRLGFSDEDDGIFWMKLQDFVKYFDTVTVLFIRDNWYYSYLSSKLTEQYQMVYLLEVDSPCSAFISCRQFATNGIIPIRLSVMSEAFLEPMGATGYTYMQAPIIATEEMKLSQGSYWVLVQVWEGSCTTPVPFTLSAYSSNEVRLTDVHDIAPKREILFNIRESSAKFESCALCNIPCSRTFQTALNKKWHAECFVCVVCHKQIQGTFFPKDNFPTCSQECFQSKKVKLLKPSWKRNGSLSTVDPKFRAKVLQLNQKDYPEQEKEFGDPSNYQSEAKIQPLIDAHYLVEQVEHFDISGPGIPQQRQEVFLPESAGESKKIKKKGKDKDKDKDKDKGVKKEKSDKKIKDKDKKKLAKKEDKKPKVEAMKKLKEKDKKKTVKKDDKKLKEKDKSKKDKKKKK